MAQAELTLVVYFDDAKFLKAMERAKGALEDIIEEAIREATSVSAQRLQNASEGE